MDLIYGEFRNGRIEDINVLQDYSFDESYGIKDSNTFECKVQRYNHKCLPDNVLYVEFTEYGGIIDTLNVNSKTGEIAYKGRTWHGVLNSHVLEPLPSGAPKQYSGEINGILDEIIQDLGVGGIFAADAVPVEDRDIEVNSFSAPYEKGYDAIIKLMKAEECKLIMYFFDGLVHIGAVKAVDFSHDEEFDDGQTPYKVGVTENNVNHLICLGKGEGEDRAVIHLFTDEQGVIQPYTNVLEPLEDSEYILDKTYQQITGKDEITEILDDPNAEIVTNYKQLAERPQEWGTQYENYYENGDIDESTGQYRKKAVKEITRDEYRPLTTPPSNWATKYGDYYYIDPEAEPKAYVQKAGGVLAKFNEGDKWATPVTVSGAFATVKSVSEAQGAAVTWVEQTGINGAPPSDWNEHYSEYYTQRGQGGYEAVGARTYERYGAGDTYDGINNLVHNGQRLTQAPPDWNWNFANYVYRTTNAAHNYVFTGVEGVPNYRADKTTAAKTPSNWANNWGSYYVKPKSKQIKKGTNIVKATGGNYITARDALTLGILKKQSNSKPYPKYQKGHFYILVQTADTAPAFTEYARVYEKFSVSDVPIWDYPNKRYFKKVVDEAPSFNSRTYYELYEDIRQVPDFTLKPYYYAVHDRLRKLVEKGIEKLKELSDNSTLEIDLELESNYDVLDLIGVEDALTETAVAKPILRKIIKIKNYMPTITYEMD